TFKPNGRLASPCRRISNRSLEPFNGRFALCSRHPPPPCARLTKGFRTSGKKPAPPSDRLIPRFSLWGAGSILQKSGPSPFAKPLVAPGLRGDDEIVAIARGGKWR